MRRREFITLVCGTVAWPDGAPAQQPKVARIGALYIGSADDKRFRFEKYRWSRDEGGSRTRWSTGRQRERPGLDQFSLELAMPPKIVSIRRRAAVVVSAHCSPSD